MMDTVEMPVYVLDRLIKSLEDAVNVCYNAKTIPDNQLDKYDESYPFATGYSRQAMREALDDLKKLK